MRILIGPIRYKVVETDIASICGDINTVECCIRLNKAMKPDIRRVTLWHEIVHGILYAAGQTDHDEVLTDAIAHGIVQVLRDNPELRQC
jgi:Zn-dependent peptidase ImmA (M78 family)